MTNRDALPAHLEQIGFQLTAAARDMYGPGSHSRRPRALPRLAIAGTGAGLAAATAAVIVLATAGAPPAYAVAQTGDGTYKITLNDIATGVPALNAKLRQLGIDTTAVPVTTTCAAPDDGVPLIGGWRASTLSQTITLDQGHITAGLHGVLAAYESPSGQIDLTIGTTAGRIPPCLNANDVVRTIQPPS